jgi:hypothetical protein
MRAVRVLATVVLVACLASIVLAEGEQWLGYRSGREVAKAVSGAQRYINAIDRPEGIETGEFEDESVLFFKWETPAVKAGHLVIAIDRATSSGAHNLLYIDSNGDGSLKDERAVDAYKTDSTHASFGPVKVVFQGEDGPNSYHLNFSLCDHGKPQRLTVKSGCWYEGQITVGGQKKYCVLVDYNVNGMFNDKAVDLNCDRIWLGSEEKQEERFVGNLLEVDGKLYRPEISPDGAYVKFAEADDVSFGQVHVPESITEFAAGGENGLFTYEPKDGVVRLPVGKYRIHHWNSERKDGGSRWKLVGSGFGEKGDFEIADTGEMKLDIGEPIVLNVAGKKKRSSWSFSQSLGGRLGENIAITRNNSRPSAPKLRVRNEKGSYDKVFSFEYG